MLAGCAVAVGDRGRQAGALGFQQPACQGHCFRACQSVPCGQDHRGSRWRAGRLAAAGLWRRARRHLAGGPAVAAGACRPPARARCGRPPRSVRIRRGRPFGRPPQPASKAAAHTAIASRFMFFSRPSQSCYCLVHHLRECGACVQTVKGTSLANYSRDIGRLGSPFSLISRRA